MRFFSTLCAIAATAIVATQAQAPADAASIVGPFVDVLKKANLNVLAGLATQHAQALVSWILKLVARPIKPYCPPFHSCHIWPALATRLYLRQRIKPSIKSWLRSKAFLPSRLSRFFCSEYTHFVVHCDNKGVLTSSPSATSSTAPSVTAPHPMFLTTTSLLPPISTIPHTLIFPLAKSKFSCFNDLTQRNPLTFLTVVTIPSLSLRLMVLY